MVTRLGYRLISFLLAGLVAYVIAVLFYTQINLSYLTDLGIDISFSDRLGAASHDLLSMTGMYFPIMLVALLVTCETPLARACFIEAPGIVLERTINP